MSRQYLFMKLRNNRQQEVKPAFDLEFNNDNYAIATPAFWRAWRGDKNTTRGKTIGFLPYAPAKYPAEQLGLQGQKLVWVVFISRAAKHAFEAKHAPAEPSNADGRIQGLGWQCIRDNTGMFLDERNKTYRSQRSPVVAWLNYNSGRYSVNVVDSAFKLIRPIPSTLTDLGDAVEWVYQHSVWRGAEGGAS